MYIPRSQMAVLVLSQWSLFGTSLLLILLTTTSNAQNVTNTKDNTVTMSATKKAEEKLVCPPASIRVPILALPCKSDKDCANIDQICCNVDGKRRCRKGVPKPPPQPKRTPILGFIPRECPSSPIIEILPVKNCTNDSECWPRICCPDGKYSYCRTPMPNLDEPMTGFTPIRSMLSYLQCSPPPPPILDLFPKVCRTPIDCFPNLCCQERGRKVCRPPKKSVISLAASVGQAFVERMRRNRGSTVIANLG